MRNRQAACRRKSAIVRQHAAAVGFERVEGVFNFVKTSLDIGQRQNGEVPEASFIIRSHLGSELVAIACEPAGFFHRRILFPVPNPRCCDRQHGRGHAGLIHHFDGYGGRPAFERVQGVVHLRPLVYFGRDCRGRTAAAHSGCVCPPSPVRMAAPALPIRPGRMKLDASAPTPFRNRRARYAAPENI